MERLPKFEVGDRIDDYDLSGGDCRRGTVTARAWLDDVSDWCYSVDWDDPRGRGHFPWAERWLCAVSAIDRLGELV